jgi:hypothetical protein
VASHVKIISPAKPLDQHHIMKTLKTIQGRCFEEKRINMYLRFQREPDSFENYNATLQTLAFKVGLRARINLPSASENHG